MNNADCNSSVISMTLSGLSKDKESNVLEVEGDDDSQGPVRTKDLDLLCNRGLKEKTDFARLPGQIFMINQ